MIYSKSLGAKKNRKTWFLYALRKQICGFLYINRTQQSKTASAHTFVSVDKESTSAKFQKKLINSGQNGDYKFSFFQIKDIISGKLQVFV